MPINSPVPLDSNDFLNGHIVPEDADSDNGLAANSLNTASSNLCKILSPLQKKENRAHQNYCSERLLFHCS